MKPLDGSQTLMPDDILPDGQNVYQVLKNKHSPQMVTDEKRHILTFENYQ